VGLKALALSLWRVSRCVDPLFVGLWGWSSLSGSRCVRVRWSSLSGDRGVGPLLVDPLLVGFKALVLSLWRASRCVGSLFVGLWGWSSLSGSRCVRVRWSSLCGACGVGPLLRVLS
jgi:hypothetical protein